MRFKAGNRVRIKSFEWYNENKDKNGNVHCGDKVFDNYMSVFCGSVVTIGGVYPYTAYDMLEDMHCRAWTDEMIEGLVEEPVLSAPNITDGVYIHEKDTKWITEYILPDGYIFKDENGNIINATKIVLEKKKKEYPKTYCECKDVLGLWDIDDTERGYYKTDLIDKLQMLLICRDAYWKIAGEEMGLGKPWSPSDNNKKPIHAITRYDGYIIKDESGGNDEVLEFPTEEMRDAFYENFKELIESCKELL